MTVAPPEADEGEVMNRRMSNDRFSRQLRWLLILLSALGVPAA